MGVAQLLMLRLCDRCKMGLFGVKWLVSGSLGLMLLYRHDGYWFSVLVGAILNAFGVKVLKRLLKQSRPKDCTKEDPGMPSSHAHMLSYFAGFAGVTGMTAQSASMFAFACAVGVERVHRGIHTLEQIAVGLVTGALGAWLWIESPGHAMLMEYDDYLRSGTNWMAHAGILAIALSGAALLSATGRFISGRIDRTQHPDNMPPKTKNA